MIPSCRSIARLFPAAALVLAAACADSTSVRPADAPESPAQLRLTCTADVAARTVRCAEPGGGGVRADRIYGQNTGMKLTSSNVAIVADSFTFDMTVTNQLEYPVGTTDGVNPDPNGIRVFFVDGIHTTQGTGSVTVANADGVDLFTATGQAFFRYLGVLQPGATTAARKWKLRFDPGVEHFTFGLYISTPVPPGGGTVQLTITSPADNAFIRDSANVMVQIDAAADSIQSVKAFVEDRSVTLAYVRHGQYAAWFPLFDLASGPHQLRVHAVTIRADTGNAYVTIIKDNHPTLTVAQPTTNQVARPNLRIDADCADDYGCVSVTALVGGTQVASGTTGIHTDFMASGFFDQQVPVTIQAMDSRGNKTTSTTYVYVIYDPSLTFVDSAGTLALDADESRLLYGDTTRTVWIKDRSGATRTQLQAGGSAGLFGYLTSFGAIFGRSSSAELYEYRSGSVQLVSVGASGVVVEGDWATWSSGTMVVRRNLQAGANDAELAGAHPDVGANGDMVYDDLGRVYRYRTGLGSVAVDSSSSGPVTDGINVLYLKAGSVMRWDGTTSTVLSTPPAGAAPHTSYEAAGGWTAFTQVTGGGGAALWVRAPDGTAEQVTYPYPCNAGSLPVIRGLSADGTLAFACDGKLLAHRAGHASSSTHVGKNWFTVHFRNNQLQLFLGNSAFSPSY